MLDLAKEFADPRIFLAIKNKVESMPKPKGDKKDKKKSAKKKPAAKQKKKGDKPEVSWRIAYSLIVCACVHQYL